MGMDPKHTVEYHECLKASPAWETLPAIRPMIVPAWPGDEHEPPAPAYVVEQRNCACGSTLGKVLP